MEVKQKFITRKQAKEGYNLSLMTINKILAKNPQCKVKVGKAVRINVAEFDKVLVGIVEI